jgi:hypothetical protein
MMAFHLSRNQDRSRRIANDVVDSQRQGPDARADGQPVSRPGLGRHTCGTHRGYPPESPQVMGANSLTLNS